MTILTLVAIHGWTRVLWLVLRLGITRDMPWATVGKVIGLWWCDVRIWWCKRYLSVVKFIAKKI